MDELLEQLVEECRGCTSQGKVATYIPELAKANPEELGIYVLQSDGRHCQAGAYQKRFTIQSVVKPILLLLALMDNGEEYVRSRVGVEATGKPFDAINVTDQTLFSDHLNPMVNMGASDIFIDDEDGWTVYTEDGLPSAQWEIMVLVTENGPEVLAW